MFAPTGYGPEQTQPILGNRPSMLQNFVGAFERGQQQGPQTSNTFANLFQPQNQNMNQGQGQMGMDTGADPFLQSAPFLQQGQGWDTKTPGALPDLGHGAQNLTQLRNRLTQMHIQQATNRMRKHQVAHASNLPY